jgi:hypothetical protein
MSTVLIPLRVYQAISKFETDKTNIKNSVAWVCEWNIPTERLPFVGEVSIKFMDRRCRMVSETDLQDRILDFLDRNHYYFFKEVPQLHSRGWVDPVPYSLILRKSGSAGNRTRNSVSVARNPDHLTTEAVHVGTLA